MSNDAYDTPDHDNSGDNEAPPPEHYAAKQQTDAENSLPMVLSVWWSFTWRSGLLFVVASFLVGMIVTIATGGDLVRIEQISGIVTLIIAIPIGIWSMGKALSVKHKGHRIIFTRDQD